MRIGRRHVLTLLWVAALSVVTLPVVTGGIGSWVDNSWQMGLVMAQRAHLTFGTQLIFTYGPLGFLDILTPVFTQQWLMAVAITLLVHVTFISAVAVLLARLRASVVLWCLTGVVLAIVLVPIGLLDSEASLLALVMALLTILTGAQRSQYLGGVLLGLILATLVMIKSTDVFEAVGIGAVCAISLLVQHRWRTALVLIGSTLAAFLVLCAYTHMGPGAVLDYFRATLEMSAGYSTAMYFFGLTPAIVVGSMVMLAIGVAFLASLRRRDLAISTWLALVGVYLFVVFKDTFVRDGPIRDANFFGLIALLAVISIALILRERSLTWTAVRRPLPALGAILLVLGIAWRATDLSGITSLTGRLDSFTVLTRAVIHHADRNALQNDIIAAARINYLAYLQALSQVPAGASIDVLPLDVGIAYAATGQRWDPRPVLQSYQAYTPWLDERDAQFLESNAAPQYVVYNYNTIDYRYPAFDEPATFRALIANYHVIAGIGSYGLVMQRDARAGAALQLSTSIGHTCAPLGSPVTVPAVAGRWVFAKVSVTPTLLGRATAILGKTAPVEVTLTTPAKSTTYRFITGVAEQGLFVSDYVTDAAMFRQVLKGGPHQPLLSFSVSSETWSWGSSYCVDFSTAAPPA